MAGPTKMRAIAVENNQRNNLRALSTLIAQLKRQETKAKSRWCNRRHATI